MQWSPEELALKSLHEWWIDAGVPPDQPISLKKKPAPTAATKTPAPISKAEKSAPAQPRRLRTDQILAAQKLADHALTIEDLKKSVNDFTGCDLRATARSTVLCDGNINADMMIICGAPDREEDKSGRPAAGANGQLLDKMFAAINFTRQDNLYIASLMPWHMLGERNPDDQEWAICRPFLQRQIELVSPKIIVTIGKMSSQILLNKTDNIAKLRGQEFQYKQESLSREIPCFPLFAPSYLRVRPAEKAKTWKDLQLIRKRAEQLGAIS